MAYGYIYLTINKVNHKTYIGQKMLKNKSWDKDRYLGSGVLLKKAIKKYGKENFEKFLIQFCESKDELNKQETFWIAEYRKRGLAQYNIANGGYGGSGPLSEETKRKISEATKGRPAWNKGKTGVYSDEVLEKMRKNNKGNLGKKFSDEHRKKIAESLKGKNTWSKGSHHTEETKKKMSEALSGENNPMFGKHLSDSAKIKISEHTKGENNPMFGKHHTEETKRKIRESKKGKPSWNKGKHHSEETKKKISESRKRYLALRNQGEENGK